MSATDLHTGVCVCYCAHQIPKWIQNPTENKTAALDLWYQLCYVSISAISDEFFFHLYFYLLTYLAFVYGPLDPR